MRRAVIDVGSNSVLLLVAERTSNAWRTVYESSRVTGLGTGTRSTKLIQSASRDATLAALKEAFSEAEAQGAESITAAGTMALRLAQNSEEFLHAAAAQGTPCSILSAEDEANLGFLSAAEDPQFRDSARLSVVDPGGHSTEVQTGDRTANGWNIHIRKSVAIGALGLLETCAPSESSGPAERLAAVREIDNAIGFEFRPGECGVVVALGAAATNLVSIREKLRVWNPDRVHGSILTYEEISRAAGWLLSLGIAERSRLPGIEQGRERTLPMGALILERFLYALRADECRVSVKGWRHALLDHPPSPVQTHEATP